MYPPVGITNFLRSNQFANHPNENNSPQNFHLVDNRTSRTGVLCDPMTSGCHYRKIELRQVPGALGEGHFTLGEDFAKCRTRRRALGEDLVGEELFAE